MTIKTQKTFHYEPKTYPGDGSMGPESKHLGCLKEEKAHRL